MTTAAIIGLLLVVLALAVSVGRLWAAHEDLEFRVCLMALRLMPDEKAIQAVKAGESLTADLPQRGD